MQPDQFVNFLKLFHAFGLGRASLQRIGEHFGENFNHVFDASHSELLACGLNHQQISHIQKPNLEQVDRELAWQEHPSNHIICYNDKSYPTLLRQIPDYPPLLYATGNIELLETPQIAIVGSRGCSTGGARTARHFASAMSQSGMTITSGMAAGIDTQAHLGALAASGNTIAVTGTGLDQIYPSKNKQLAYDIHEKGLLVSELALGTGPRGENFPRRNRIISGLSVATLVVEANHRSGSLITARQALEQGREVFAIPGSIHNPQSRGCHQLIREGAYLVDQTSDIIEELGSLLGFVAEQQSPSSADKSKVLDIASQKLLKIIDYEPITMDELVETSGLTIDKLSSMLLLLELQDFIESVPGDCYVRI